MAKIDVKHQSITQSIWKKFQNYEKKMIDFLYSLCTISKVYYLENYFAKKKRKKKKIQKKRTGKTRIKCLFCLLHKISIKIIGKYSKTLTGILLLTRGHYFKIFVVFCLYDHSILPHLFHTVFILYVTFLF